MPDHNDGFRPMSFLVERMDEQEERDEARITAIKKALHRDVIDQYLPAMGHVAILGVTQAWRRQGIALALLHHAFGEFKKRGATAC